MSTPLKEMNEFQLEAGKNSVVCGGLSTKAGVRFEVGKIDEGTWK